MNNFCNFVTQELNRIAKLGLEMRLMTSEMEAEAEKWEDPDNEIVRRAKNMSGLSLWLCVEVNISDVVDHKC